MPYQKKRFILIIDGDARDLFMTGMILQRLEYDVYILHSAEEAIEIMGSARPDLVLTELILPQMSGMDLLHWIKQNPETDAVPVIIYTRSSDPSLEELCLASGCASLLMKPAEPNVLFSAIQHATEATPRQYIRLRTLLPARMEDPAPSGEKGGKEYVLALSENGVYIRTLAPRPVDAVLTITIIMDMVPIRIRAKVLYSFTMGHGPFKESGMGMKFLDIAPADRDRIRHFIKGQLVKDIPAHHTEGLRTAR